MKKYKTTLVPLFIATVLYFSLCEKAISIKGNQVENYQPIFFLATDKLDKSYVAIRSYDFGGDDYFLVVDPHTLETSRKKSTELTLKKDSLVVNEPIKGRYFKMLNKYNSPPYLEANHGLKHKDGRDGVYLTIDMCPSKKPFEKEFFEKLIKISRKNQKPLPISVAVSGLWIIGHQEEFKWLISQKENLDITWINHSFSHPYNSLVPNKNNFLLSKDLDVKKEILQTEKLLIENDQNPSVFFRFPGLISDENLINLLNKYGLIPIGSDAWIAKGQKLQDGSIILVHGNSNEHDGIVQLNKILDEENLEFLPLND